MDALDRQPASAETPDAIRPRTLLPADDPLRRLLHDEVHARPPARIRLPALVVYVAFNNVGVTREHEWAHLRGLPGQQDLPLQAMQGNFLRLRCGGWTVKWERHTEFSRYSIVQPLPPQVRLGRDAPALDRDLVVPAEWLRAIPGQMVAAIELALLAEPLHDVQHRLAQARAWFDHRPGGCFAGRQGRRFSGGD
jgi:uncharacterized membrane-anchored protein